MQYIGSCHCGRVKLEAEGEIKSAMACNCSICQRKGSLLWFIPRAAMHLLTPEENATTYTFNKHRIQHRFCPICGTAPYSIGKGPDGSEMAAINIRCIENIDLEAIPVTHYDGRKL